MGAKLSACGLGGSKGVMVARRALLAVVVVVAVAGVPLRCTGPDCVARSVDMPVHLYGSQGANGPSVPPPDVENAINNLGDLFGGLGFDFDFASSFPTMPPT